MPGSCCEVVLKNFACERLSADTQGGISEVLRGQAVQVGIADSGGAPAERSSVCRDRFEIMSEKDIALEAPHPREITFTGDKDGLLYSDWGSSGLILGTEGNCRLYKVQSRLGIDPPTPAT